MDNFRCVLLVFRLTREGERVLGLAIRDLVNPEDRDSVRL